MAVLEPLLVHISGFEVISNGASSITMEIPDFPFDPSRGAHSLEMTDKVFIDKSDFRVTDDEVGWGRVGECSYAYAWCLLYEDGLYIFISMNV